MNHQRLKEMRKLSGMTQFDLASKLSYSVNHYHLIEQGSRVMPDGFYQRALKKMIDHNKQVGLTLLNESKMSHVSSNLSQNGN